MRLKIGIILFMLFLTAGFHLNSAGADELLNQDGITVWADFLTHNMEEKTYLAKGNVMILWSDAILVADTAVLNESTGDAFAEGRVRLVKGGDVLYCDRITLNLETEKGEIENGNLFNRRSNFHIEGDKIEKIGKDEFRLDHGTFTICNGDRPSWKFTAQNIDVTLDSFAVGKNALFYIKDVPVLYFPYLLFPVKRERQSGFLFPKFGNSSKKGFNFNIPYYWAISPSQEAEIELDVQSKRGAGLNLDYNWKRPAESSGDSHLYAIYDQETNQTRGNLALQLQEWISPSLALKSDINLVSDHNFFLDYADISGQYNKQILDSSLSLTKNWEKYSFSAETRYVDDLYAASNTRTLQKLPDIRFTAIKNKIDGVPIYLGLDSQFVNFYEDKGVRGQRLKLHPTATLYLTVTDGVQFSGWGGYSERLYNAYSGNTGEGSQEIGLADAGAKFVASFTKVYDTNWGTLQKMRHVLVPEVGYGFVEEKSQASLPAFDFNDRVPGQSIINWAITNYLTGRFQEGDAPPDYREILYLRLSQGYQLRGTRRDLLTLVDDGKHFMDLGIEANFSPLKNLSFFTDSRFNTYKLRFSTIILGFELNNSSNDNKDDSAKNSAELSYRFAGDREIGTFSATSILDPVSTTGDQENYLQAGFKLGFMKPFTFSNTTRYSLDKGGFLESIFSLEYKHQCWSVEFSYHDRPVLGDRAFMVNINLAGLGPIGKYKAF